MNRTFAAVTILLCVALLPGLVNAQVDANRVYPVYTDMSKIETISKTLMLRGKITVPRLIDVYSTFGGDVIELNFDEGDQVRKGEVVARVKRIDPGVHYEPESVTASLGGTVTKRYVSKGARITPQTKIVEITQNDPLIFRADVLEIDLGRVREGLKGTVELASGQVIENVPLIKLMPFVNPQTSTVAAEFTLPNKNRSLRANTSGSVTLLLDQHPGITVSRDAVIERNREQGVFKIVDGKSIWVPVKIVSDLGARLEVQADQLGAEVQVVTFGHDSIMDGSSVRIQEDLR